MPVVLFAPNIRLFSMSKALTVKAKPVYKTQHPETGSSSWLLGSLATLATIVAFLWLTRQASWMPDPVRDLLMLGGNDNKVFMASVDLNRDGARELYRKALTELQESNYEAALAKLKRLEGVYPGLQDFLWLHEAEAYAGQGNEWAVQKKLTTLLEKQMDSPLQAAALYRIGQSRYRGSEWSAAMESFKSVREKYPNSAYALGSLYYQGALLGKNEKTRAQAAEPLKAYLSECPDCKFSGDAADLLEKTLPHPTPAEHGLIGVAQATASKDFKKTLAHLTQSDRRQSWRALGETQIRAGQTNAGLQTLAQGLPQEKDLDEVRAGVDFMLAHAQSETQKADLLKALTLKSFKIGGDYVLWKLAEIDSEQAPAYYQQITRNYPDGDYAPESGWRLIWPLLANGQNAAFIEQGQQYLTRYAYSKSAPKVLFWIAKLLEKSSPSEATRAYERILQQYPTTYYAFRAKGRLHVLAEGKRDLGWPTLTGRTDYPGQPTSLNTLNILPPAEQWGGEDSGWRRYAAAKELQRIGAADDLRLMATDIMGDLPPALESWADQVSGDRAKGLRAIRDGLDEQAKQSFLASGGKNLKPIGTSDELKLLYPIYFSDIIEIAGDKNQLDPFLIQSLMREESYFNEFAISGSNARGLMQLLPSTAREVAGWEGLSSFQTGDLFLPAVNIRLGSRYLAHLHQLFNGNSMPAVGAYNGGPGAMKRWTQGLTSFNSDPDMFVEKIPYEQSRDYIKKVFASYWNYSRLYSHPTL